MGNPAEGHSRQGDEVFTGDSEMAALMRTIDWSATPLGPVENWPQSLRTAVSICLHSRFPILIWWGPDLVELYNDAYRRILGSTKHPKAMGQQGKECWPEIWHIIGPMLEGVLTGGEATWSDDQLLLINRNGYLEESYFTFSYSPIRDETGGVGGVFCAVTETTDRVLSERRISTLRGLAARSSEAKTVTQTCRTAMEVLSRNRYDVPFAILYLMEPQGKRAYLAGTSGLDECGPATPGIVDLRECKASQQMWPFSQVVSCRKAVVVEELSTRFGSLPTGPWPDAPDRVLIMPLQRAGQEQLAGFLVAGVSPRRALDDSYRGFLGLVAGQVAAAIADTRAYEAERQRAEMLSELDQAKTAFFSNMSHEFRTPLTLLLGPAREALDDTVTPLPALQRERLEIVLRNAQRLNNLVDTLLDFSRIEAGRLEAVYAPTDLAKLTTDLASVFRSTIERAGLQLIVECAPLQEPVFVDREMWERIVLNLVSNAFKFTLEGEIGVSLHPAGDRVVLKVRDTGVGIPPEELPRIFERFHRVRDNRARTQEGTGIGLTLVQELVRLHGGAIEVESEEGRGTTFTVSIPAGAAHLPPDRIGSAQALPSSGVETTPYLEEALRWTPDEAQKGMRAPMDRSERHDDRRNRGDEPSAPSAGLGNHDARILVVDDNADMRDYLRRLLGGRWTVETAGDGMAALEMIRSTLPDVVLSDVMMPNLDGFELTRALRADHRTSQIRVILLSARAGEESRVEGLEAGADDYLVKPFSARELLAHVAAHVELSRMHREAIRAREEFISVASHELRTPLTSLRGFSQLLLRLADRYAQEDPSRLRQAVQVIHDQAVKLSRLVEQLLDLSRIESGKLSLRTTEVDLVPLVRGVVEAAQVGASLHRLSLSAPDSVKAVVDPLRLEQVITNLLDNAIRYSPDGGTVEVEVEAPNPGRACISVRDHGIGIPREHHYRIFDRFYQAHSDRNMGGLGLGLYVSNQIVALHGGEIAVESPPTGGARFVVNLPTGLVEGA